MNEILRNLNANLDLKSENYGSKYREIEQKKIQLLYWGTSIIIKMWATGSDRSNSNFSRWKCTT